MAELVAKTPCDGLLPVSAGGVTCEEIVIDRMALVAPLRGRQAAVAAALDSALGIGFPAPNRTLQSNRGRAIWVGPGQALVTGALPDLTGLAAVTDQSDGVACVVLRGDDAAAVLARLVPVDLRMPAGETRRTLVGHMTASVTRVDAGFEVMVMRSMAATLVHELHRAMKGLALR